MPRAGRRVSAEPRARVDAEPQRQNVERGKDPDDDEKDDESFHVERGRPGLTPAPRPA
jgi:hypothetical protein